MPGGSRGRRGVSGLRMPRRARRPKTGSANPRWRSRRMTVIETPVAELSAAETLAAAAHAAEIRQKRMTSALLYLDGVHVSFDGFHAINNLSLVLEPGEMRAIIGPNGAGKTTMMDIITGKTKPDEGDVYFDGSVDLTQLDEAAIAELGIGRKFQKPTVFESQTVGDNIMLAMKAPRDPFRTLFDKM